MLPRLTDDVLYASELVEIWFEDEAGALRAEARIAFLARTGEGRRVLRGHDVIEMRSHLAALGLDHAEGAATAGRIAA